MANHRRPEPDALPPWIYWSFNQAVQLSIDDCAETWCEISRTSSARSNIKSRHALQVSHSFRQCSRIGVAEALSDSGRRVAYTYSANPYNLLCLDHLFTYTSIVRYSCSLPGQSFSALKLGISIQASSSAHSSSGPGISPGPLDGPWMPLSGSHQHSHIPSVGQHRHNRIPPSAFWAPAGHPIPSGRAPKSRPPPVPDRGSPRFPPFDVALLHTITGLDRGCECHPPDCPCPFPAPCVRCVPLSGPGEGWLGRGPTTPTTGEKGGSMWHVLMLLLLPLCFHGRSPVVLSPYPAAMVRPSHDDGSCRRSWSYLDARIEDPHARHRVPPTKQTT